MIDYYLHRQVQSLVQQGIVFPGDLDLVLRHQCIVFTRLEHIGVQQASVPGGHRDYGLHPQANEPIPSQECIDIVPDGLFYGQGAIEKGLGVADVSIFEGMGERGCQVLLQAVIGEHVQ